MNSVYKNKLIEWVKIVCVVLGAFFITFICNAVLVEIYKCTYMTLNTIDYINLNQIDMILAKSPLFLIVLSISNIFIIFLIFKITKKFGVKIVNNLEIKKDLKMFIVWILIAFVNMVAFVLFGMVMNLFDYVVGTYSEFTIITVIQFVITGLVYSVISGFCEELIHRGYILNRLKEISPKYALVISSIIFMFSEVLGTQFRIIDFVGVFLAGIFFGYLYLSTSSIFPGAGFHSGVHFVLLMVTKFQDMPIYQGPVFSIFNSHADLMIGNVSVGSSYGITTAVINLICIVLLYLYNKCLKVNYLHKGGKLIWKKII
ncbi:CPBP family intramembrane glutamic endopeptidase [Clostridium butyricum]|nr:CPBP family intramembrane metalloprotease [Clostridium butyricum]